MLTPVTSIVGNLNADCGETGAPLMMSIGKPHLATVTCAEIVKHQTSLSNAATLSS